MTVLTTTSRMSPYACNGVTTTFAYTFPILAPEHLTVYFKSSIGEVTLLALNTNYTVTGAGDGGGGNVVCTVAPANAGTLIILRIIPVLQTTDFQNQGRFFPETHERAFDRDIMIDQQFLEALERTLQSSITDPLGPWDAKGRRIINLGDAILNTDAVNLRTLLQYLSNATAGGALNVTPQYWAIEPFNNVTKEFYLPGADVSSPYFYDVVLDGKVIEPVDGYSIVIGGDLNASKIVFVTAPAATITEGWVVLRGYAKPVNDVANTLINNSAFIAFLTSLITNTLYASNVILNLGKLAFLIPIKTIAGTTGTADKTYNSSLSLCTNAAATAVQIRKNDGTVSLDWDTGFGSFCSFSQTTVGGQVTLLPPSGVPFKIPAGYLAKTRGVNCTITATNIGTDIWELSGDLAIDAGAGSQYSNPVTTIASVTGALVIDCAKGDFFKDDALQENTALSVINAPTAGNAQKWMLRIRQDATGGRTMTLPASFKQIAGSDAAIQSAANAYTVLTATSFDQGVRWEYNMRAGG